jgi:hypothetical protein
MQAQQTGNQQVQELKHELAKLASAHEQQSKMLAAMRQGLMQLNLEVCKSTIALHAMPNSCSQAQQLSQQV